jgi:hypothetical protein
MSAANAIKNQAEPQEPFDVRERRMSPRVTTLMRAAKLIGLSGEYPCVVRDVSETGLRVKLFHPLPEGRVALELAPGVHYFVERVWETNNEAGFLSAAAIDVDEFLGVIGRNDGPAWFKVWISGAVRSRNSSARVTVRALSQQGADIETGTHFALDEVVVLEADGLPRLDARIAARNLSGYRLILADAFRLDELAKAIWALPRWEADPRFEVLDGGKADQASA